MNMTRATRMYSTTLVRVVCLVMMLTLSAHAQEVVDCEARPGEYIVKYKSKKRRSLAAKEAAQKPVREMIGGKTTQVFSEISPDLEFVEHAAPLAEAARLLSAPALAEEIEYIQPNCIHHLNDFSVTGNLRDPGRKTAAYPLTVVVPASDSGSGTPILNVLSPHQGLNALALEVPARDDKGAVVWREFAAAKIALWQDPVAKDGLIDLLLVGKIAIPDPNYGDSNRYPYIMTMKNKGNGSFQTSGSERLSTNRLDYISALSKAFVDADTEPDFIVGISSLFSGRVAILSRYDGDSFSKTFLDASGVIKDLQAADINGDGITDIVALVDPPGQIRSFDIFLGRGDMRFSARTSLPTPDLSGATGFQLKDINLDGRIDLTMLSNNEIVWRLNQGQGTFGPDLRYNFGHTYGAHLSLSAEQFVVTDVNGDSWPDIVGLGFYYPPSTAEDRTKKPVITLMRNANGSFTGAHSFLFGEYIQSYKEDQLFVDDVNGDGRLDVAIARGAHNNVTVLLNAQPQNTGQLASLLEEPFYGGEMLGQQPLKGIFLDPYALADIPVSLTGGGQTFWAYTNESGDYTFTGIPAGTYVARTHLDRYEFPTLDGKNVTITQNSVIPTHLGKRMPPVQPPPPAVPALNATNDFGFNSLWGHYNYGQEGGLTDVDVDAPEAWSLTRGEGVVVGVIDSGVDVEHPDMKNNVFINNAEIPNNGRDDDGNGYIDDSRGFNPITNTSADPVDDNGHGTGVAGIIAAEGNNVDGLVGVAPKVRVVGIKAGHDRALDLRSILGGVDYLIKAKKRGVNVRVVNASYGSTRACSKTDLDYASALHANGILLVVAAGNEANDNDAKPSSPANCDTPSLLSVASVNRSGALSEFSNYGKTTVDVAAPGGDIVMLSPEAGYRTSSGTSMAAPYVSGVAALLFSRNPNLTPTEVKKIIMESTKPIPSLEGKVVSPGVVSAAVALGLRPRGGPLAPPSSSPQPGPPPFGITGKPITMTNGKTPPKNKTPYSLKASEPLSPQSLSCFKATFSPKRSGQSVTVSIKGSTVAFSLVQKRGRKTTRVAWPSKGTLSVKIKGNCAVGSNGSLLDTDGNGSAGGPAQTVSVRVTR